MKLTNALVILILALTINNLSANSFKINFIENNLETAMEQAQKEGKLIMVDFWASWCSPCKWMDEQTFSRPEVADYLNKHYITARIDVDNFDGITYKNKYDIRFLPTILVLNPDGKVIKKYEESMAPSKLIRILKDHDENKILPPYVNRNMVQSINKTQGSANNEVKDAPPAFYPSTTGTSQNLLAQQKPAIRSQLNKPNTTSYSVTRNTVTNKPTVNTTPIDNSIYKANNVGKISNSPVRNYNQADFRAISSNGLFQFNVKQGPTSGYSIQVGAYYDYHNVLTEVAKFQKSFAEEVLVHISELNGTTCYKIMVGHYMTHREASKDKILIKESGVRDAFVKDIATLQLSGNLAMVD